MTNTIRVRMAPSPTGNLHIGTVRTALFNWLFARHHGGAYILRIEDTDRERSKKEFEDNLLEGFEWLGLKWDEFYRQSDRTKIYSKYIQKLLTEKKAFWCHHSETELEAERRQQFEAKDLPRHICVYKFKTQGHDSTKGGVIRLAVDTDSQRKLEFTDRIKGRIEFLQNLLGDFSIAKDLDTPLYNFAVAVDDYEMDISHVIRGEDHIANTPKQILIQEALGFKTPEYIHLPLILGEDRSKLSKRNGTTALSDYRELGYLPEAIVNFLGLLGWSPTKNNREILTKNELVEFFNLDGIHKSGAVFDVKKLRWVNNQYIRMMNDDGLLKALSPFVEKHFANARVDIIDKSGNLLRERLEFLDQISEFHYFFKQPVYQSDLLIWKKGSKDQAKNALNLIVSDLNNLNLNEKNIREALDLIAVKHFSEDRGAVYWPLRVALSGEIFSADPVQILLAIGLEETQTRIRMALSIL